MKRRAKIIDKAIEASGGGATLARELGLKSRQAVYQWTRIPAEHCPKVERLSGISRHLLRPDIYGPQPVEAK